jgi:hypothetical protein
MSLDYPFYQRLRAARHPAARWWRVGDSIHYLGLLVVVFGPTCVWPVLVLAQDALPVASAVAGAFVAGAFVTFAVGLLIIAVGARTKREAYRRAALDGIKPDP